MASSIHCEEKPFSAFSPRIEHRLAEFELTFDAAPIGIFLCDRDFAFIRVNRSHPTTRKASDHVDRSGSPCGMEPARHGFGHQVITEITPRALDAEMAISFEKRGCSGRGPSLRDLW
jgi:hypothetical protein